MMKANPLIKWRYVLLFLVLAFNLSAQSPEASIQNIIEKQAEKFLKNKSISAVSIGIYKDNSIYTGHFGSLVKNENNPPNDETLYEIGSVSKTVTGYLVAKAIVEGRFSLDEEIQTYLDGDYSNLKVEGRAITIRDLLTHTSGLPLFLPLEMNGLYETLAPDVPEKYRELEASYSKAQFLEDLKKIKLSTPPGSRYSYSNAGTEILGYLLERIYDKSIDELIEETFHSPYDLTSLSIQITDERGEQLAKGYWLNNDTQAPNNLNTLWATGSGMKMNMGDMMKYAKLQLDAANPIIQESRRIISDSNNTQKTAYLWQVKQDKYGTYYNHHGGTSGVQNWLFIFPKYDLAISIITNSSSNKTPKLLSKTALGLLKEIINR